MARGFTYNTAVQKQTKTQKYKTKKTKKKQKNEENQLLRAIWIFLDN